MRQRTKGWEGRLRLWLASQSKVPFQLGSHDCALFAAGAVMAVRGQDFAAEWRGEYQSMKQGLKALKQAGFKDHVDFVRKNFEATTSPQPADLAVVETPDGPALGVVQGIMIYVPAATGWGLVPLSAATDFFEV